MTAHEKAVIVAGRVAAWVREVAPEGLGHWGPVWGLVSTPSDVFMDALAEWETEDSTSVRRRGMSCNMLTRNIYWGPSGWSVAPLTRIHDHRSGAPHRVDRTP